MAGCLLLFASFAAAQPIANTPIVGPKLHCTATFQQFRTFSENVWERSWKNPKPKSSTIRAKNRKLGCMVGRGHLRASKKRWRSDRRAYLKHRKRKLAEARERRRQRLRVTRDWCSPTPHPEGAGCWEIPAWCVEAESGTDWTAHNPTSPARGAYQLLGHGEPWPVDSWQDAMAHHRIAESLYAAGGLGPWVAC